MQERTVQLGNTTAVCTTLDDGTQSFRINPTDVESIEILMLDNVGRQRVISGFMSTMLVLEAVGAHGTLAYDAHPDPNARDEHGRRVFLQRPALSREEVFEMISGVVAKQQTGVVLANDKNLGDINRKIRDFRGPRP